MPIPACLEVGRERARRPQYVVPMSTPCRRHVDAGSTPGAVTSTAEARERRGPCGRVVRTLDSDRGPDRDRMAAGSASDGIQASRWCTCRRRQRGSTAVRRLCGSLDRRPAPGSIPYPSPPTLTHRSVVLRLRLSQPCTGAFTICEDSAKPSGQRLRAIQIPSSANDDIAPHGARAQNPLLRRPLLPFPRASAPAGVDL